MTSAKSILGAMAHEVRHLLDDGVDAGAADVDTVSWPVAFRPFVGGITGRLDDTGASRRVAGGRLAEIPPAAAA